MTFELTILSIFRQSESYLARYFSQVEQAFALQKGPCHTVWLEGDSQDSTYELLQSYQNRLESQGHHVTLVKLDLKGPYWLHSVNHPSRWRQLATCWNKCMEYLAPSHVTVCVESDLIWDPCVLQTLTLKLSHDRHVICPMMMTESSMELYGIDRFYDAWGFSRNGKKFTSLPPYWEKDLTLYEDHEFLQVTTGGGMLVSTYNVMKRATWSLDTCILQFSDEVKLFMDKTVRIYHPTPEKWKNLSLLKRMLRIIKYRLIMLGKYLKQRVYS